MKVTNWLKHTNDPDLQKAANVLIADVQAMENKIPGVIIIHNIADDSIAYLSERGRRILNVTLEEIRLPHHEYHHLYFNPEDVPNYAQKILDMLDRNDDDEIVTYFQQVRPTNDHPWIWYSTSCKIFLRDKQGKPLLAIAVAIPIEPQNYITPKLDRLIDENTFLRKNHKVFNTLTKREKEILGYLAVGNTPKEISEKLFLSEATVLTHKRNLRSKLKINATVDLLKFAQAFDLI